MNFINLSLFPRDSSRLNIEAPGQDGESISCEESQGGLPRKDRT